MIRKLTIQSFLHEEFSHIIDVRSPREFAESHIPSVVNFAVLNDSEFEQVGTLYKQNPFEARVLGASFVSANMAQHLLKLKDMISPKKPVGIHCARGGMRSLSMAIILDNIGYQVALLENGYKAYRSEVVRYLQSPLPHRFITLVGQTGSGKSEIIEAFTNALDLEGMSKHLGSSFGAILGNQPSPKMFSNLLFTRLRELEGVPFTLVEGESKKIGSVILPSILYQSYQSAPKILIQTPLEKRIERIVKQYGKITPMFFETAMQKIMPFMQKTAWQEAKDSFYRGDLHKVAEILLVAYYDKVYKKESYDCVIPYHTIPQVIAEITDFANKYYQ